MVRLDVQLFSSVEFGLLVFLFFLVAHWQLGYSSTFDHVGIFLDLMLDMFVS